MPEINFDDLPDKAETPQGLITVPEAEGGAVPEPTVEPIGIDFSGLPDKAPEKKSEESKRLPSFDTASALMPAGIQHRDADVKDSLSLAAGYDISPQSAFSSRETFKKKLKETSLWDKAAGSLKAGMGDVYTGMGGVLELAGLEGEVADNYKNYGERLRLAYIPPTDTSTFTYKKVMDPEWWATNVTRSVPFTMSLIPAAIVGAYGGVAVAGAAGLGAFGTTIMGSIGGAALARPLESAFEAANAKEEALAKGMTEAEAEKAAVEVFKGNMTLVGLDAAQFAVAFTPLRYGVGLKSTLLKRMAATTGKLSAVAVSEAGEERYQEYLQMQALEEEGKFFDINNPRLNEASTIGGIFGLGMGGAGSVWTSLTAEVSKDMPEDVKSAFDTAKAEAIAGGAEESEATLTALDAVAETPEGKEHIESVIEDIKGRAEGTMDVAAPVEEVVVPEIEEALGRITTEDLTEEELGAMLETFAAGRDIIAETVVAPVDTIKQRLIDTGMEEGEAASNAALFDGFRVMAQRAGVSVDEVMERFLPEVTREEVGVAEGEVLEQVQPISQDVIEKTKTGFDFKGQSKVFAADVFANEIKQPEKEIRDRADALIESGEFDKLPEIDVPINKLIPTQRFIHASNLDRVKDSTPDTNAHVLKIGDDYYVLDGHHRIAVNVVNQESVISAHVFDSELTEEELALAQEAPQEPIAPGAAPRARVTFLPEGAPVIEFLKDADKSSFIHETGHIYMKMMKELSALDTASEGLKTDYETLREWMGVSEVAEDLTREQQEQFARGFEAYLREGKAPTSALAEAFENFKQWLMDVYLSLKELNVELTDDVRGVMDRMLADEGVALEQAPLKKDLQSIFGNDTFNVEEIERRIDNGLYVTDIIPKEARTKAKGSNLETGSSIAKESLRSVRQEDASDFAGIENPLERKTAAAEIRNAEIVALREYAEQNDLILSDFAKTLEKEGNRGGTENLVYRDKSTGRWMKANFFTHSPTFSELFDRIMIHNVEFESEAYQLEGFAEVGGEFLPVFSQAHIHETEIIDNGELEDLASDTLKSMGYIGESDFIGNIPLTKFISPEGVAITDINSRNVTYVDGDVAFVDPVIVMDAESKDVRVRDAIDEARVGVEVLEQAAITPPIKTIRDLAKSLGGIDFNREHMKGELDKLKQDVPGMKFIINKKDKGVTLDDLLISAIDEGILDQEATLDDLLSALEINLETPSAMEDRLFEEEMREREKEGKAIAKEEKEKLRLVRKRLKAAVVTPRKVPVKTRVRRITGQVIDKELIALRDDFVRAARTAREAFKRGDTEGVTRERARMQEIALRAKTRTTETVSINKLKKAILKEIKTTAVKKISGKPRGKFGADIQSVLDGFREAVKMTHIQATEKINQNLEKYLEMGMPDEVVIENRILDMVARLKEIPEATPDKWAVKMPDAKKAIRVFDTEDEAFEFKATQQDADLLEVEFRAGEIPTAKEPLRKRFTADELTTLLEEIKALKNEGKMLTELKRLQTKERHADMVDEAIDVIMGGKPLPEGLETVGVEQKKPPIKEFTAWLQNFTGNLGTHFVGWNDLMDMMSARDKTSEPGKSRLNELADVHANENARKAGQREASQQIADIAKESFDFESDREMLRQFNLDAKDIEIGTFVNSRGVRVNLDMTKAEARKFVMEYSDPSLRETFVEGMSFTDEMIKAVKDSLTAQDMLFIEKQQEFYRTYYDRVNEVYRELYGVNLPFNEFYSPIRREGFDAPDGLFGEFLDDISYRRSVTSGSFKSRIENVRRIAKQSDVNVLERHIAEMEHFIAWGEKMRDLNAIFKNQTVRSAIKLHHEPSLLFVVDKFLNDFTRGGIETAARLNALDKFRGHFTRSVLAIKPNITIKQLTSVVAYLEVMPMGDFLSGMADFWTSPLENARFLKKNSVWFRERSAHMERDIKTAIRMKEYSAFRETQGFIDSLMLNVTLGDQGAIAIGGWAYYKYLTEKKGMSQADAITEFEKFSEMTQQSSDLSLQSDIQRMGSFAKLFSMFLSAPNLYMRKELGAIRNLLAGRGSKAKHMKTIAIYHIVLPMFFQWVSDLFDWDEDEQLRAVILGPLNGLFIAGDAIDGIIRKALGLRTFSKEVAIYSAGTDLEKATSEAIKLISEGHLTDAEFYRGVRGLAGGVGAFTGLPLKQAVDQVKTGINFVDGEYEKALKGLLGFSPFLIESQDTKKKGQR